MTYNNTIQFFITILICILLDSNFDSLGQAADDFLFISPDSRVDRFSLDPKWVLSRFTSIYMSNWFHLTDLYVIFYDIIDIINIEE